MILYLQMKIVINLIFSFFYTYIVMPEMIHSIYFIYLLSWSGICLPGFVLMTLKNWCLQVCADFLWHSLAVRYVHTVRPWPLTCSVLRELDAAACPACAVREATAADKPPSEGAGGTDGSAGSSRTAPPLQAPPDRGSEKRTGGKTVFGRSYC